MESPGGVVSSVTVLVMVLTLPALSSAVKTMCWLPSSRVRSVLKIPSPLALTTFEWISTPSEARTCSMRIGVLPSDSPFSSSSGLLVTSRLRGVYTYSVGGYESSVTMRWMICLLPASSVASTMMVFTPSVKVTNSLMTPVVELMGTPLRRTTISETSLTSSS